MHPARRLFRTTILFVVVCLYSSGFAQRGRIIVSPEVHPDRRVTFRLRAPQAGEVFVEGSCLSGPQPMKRADAGGDWSLTIGPIEPEVYEYHFVVDGLNVPDPVNPSVKVWRRTAQNMLDVPGEPPAFWQQQDVPHGTVHVHAYRSASLGVTRGLYVYTPPGYETGGETQYPVLYLLHGSGDTELTWTVVGRANAILDNALAAGRAKPMIVVMPYGHTPPSSGGFQEDLIEDVIPFVQKHYRAQTEPQSRAIVGLSMGGGQALRVGLRNVDRFAYIGAFSSTAPSGREADALLSDPDGLNRKLRLLWVGCGKSDFLFKSNQALLDALRSKNVKHTARITEGAHAWPIWRGYLNELLPLLFAEP